MLRFLLIYCFVIVGTKSGHVPSGLYQNDGDGHTILAQKFTKKDIREMSFDLLSLMGFQDRPHPHLIESHSPANQFLKEVYEALLDDDHHPISGERGSRISKSSKFTSTSSKNTLKHSSFNLHNEEINAINEADSIVSFLNRGHRYSTLLKNIQSEKTFWFDVTEISSQQNVIASELRIWKKHTSNKNPDELNDAFRISVSMVVPIPSSKKAKDTENKNDFHLEELDELIVSIWEEGWLRLNVTEAFRRWILNPSSNYGLVLSTKRADDGTEISMDSSGIGTFIDVEEYQPFLVAFLEGESVQKTKPHRSKRPIRSAGNPQDYGSYSSGSDSSNKKRGGRKSRKRNDFEEFWDRPRSCQMGMLYVNFEDLGWKDWVIAPDGFIAYYCTGECSFPLTAAMNATNHAIVSTLVHTYYPTEFPKPSCAPLKLGSISMLYYDDNSNVTVKKYKDMVIKSCGCK